MLLRYPMPPPPNGPSTFVDDALYLRQHIMHDGGSCIIEKYSENSGTGKGSRTSKSRSGKRAEQFRRPDSTKSLSPSLSASRFLQEKGGIETIIQEAAKGVYSRGEKWGVNKALRGAVEGLQSGSNYSRRQLDGSRWSLDEGPSTSQLAAEIKTLEQRSKGLAKLLDKAIGELWEQQRQCSNEKNEASANALSLAIAKIQFVQVYLENPTMPFTGENPESETAIPKDSVKATTNDMLMRESQPAQLPSLDTRSSSRTYTSEDPGTLQIDSEKGSEGRSETPTNATPDVSVPKVRPQSLPFHHPRPSLAQSSFSWMLGEDQRKSSFVSPTPFPADRRAARQKADLLFGEGKVDTEGKTQKGNGGEESDDEEVINLGTLKGRR